MQKIIALIIAGIMLAGCGGRQKNDYLSSFPKESDPKEIGIRLVNHFLESEHMIHQGVRIHYAEVCLWYGALEFAEITGDKQTLNKLADRFEPFFTSEKSLLPDRKHVDHNMFGSLPLELYHVTKDQRYLTMGLDYADSQWTLPVPATDIEKKNMENGLSWQTRMWIDDMFMITILQTQAYKITGDRKYIDRAAKEMVAYLENLQCENGLFYHSPEAPFFWGRGNGWVAVGMTLLLNNLPEDSTDRPEIMKSYTKMMGCLLKYQQDNGLWNQLIDAPEFWTETSGSAMFTYAMIKGIKNGWLNSDEYGPAARKSWLALVDYINEDNDVTEICIGTNKENDRQYYYDRPRVIGDFHGQAPYVWCAAALCDKTDK